MSAKRLPLVALVVVVAGALVWAAGQWRGGPIAGNRASTASIPPSSGTVRAAAEAAAPLTMTIVPDQSTARYRVREQLANLSFPIDAVGQTTSVQGTVGFDASGKLLADVSWVTVNLATLQSDQRSRDNFIRQNTLQTNRYPQARFEPTEIDGLPFPLPHSGQAEVTIRGNLTIRDVTRPVEWTGTASFTPDGMRIEAQTTITFDQFGMARPRAAIVLSVANEIRLETDFFFKSAG